MSGELLGAHCRLDGVFRVAVPVVMLVVYSARAIVWTVQLIFEVLNGSQRGTPRLIIRKPYVGVD